LQEIVMKIPTRRRSTLFAAVAALALTASFSGAANAAQDPLTAFLNFLTSAPANSKVNLGQGSGNAGAIGR
jgi:hypothetical protein